MRLGQLTRQLDIGATQVVKFLKADGIEIENHPNTKLDEDIVSKLFDRFGKEKAVESTSIDETVEEQVNPAENQPKLEEQTEEVIPEKVERVEEVIEEITETIPKEKSTPSEITDEIEIVTLPKEEVDKLVEQGEIVSEIEAEAATLSEDEIIKAKFTTLEGLSVKGKIELPRDPRREKKEAARKVQDEILKEKANAGKTIDGVHPNKRAKEEGEKAKADLLKSEEEALKRLERRKKHTEKEAARLKKNEKKKKTSKKKKKPVEKTLSPEEMKKKAAREKRQRLKEKANAPAAPRSFWQKIWDAIK